MPDDPEERHTPATKRELWAKGYELFAESTRRYLRQHNFRPDNIDSSEALMSAARVFASHCEERGLAIDEIDNLGGLFHTIAIRKLSAQYDHWKAKKRGAGLNVPLDQDADPANLPADPDATSGSQDMMIAEAWEQRFELIAQLKALLAEKFAEDPETVAEATRILDRHLEGVKQSEIAAEMGHTPYFVSEVIKNCRQWTRETWKDETEDYDEAVDRAKQTRRERLERQRASSDASESGL